MSARAVVATLAGMSDAELSELFTLRKLDPSASWHDAFDIADALLTSENIALALALMPREHTGALLDAGDGPVAASALPTARKLGLVDSEHVLFAAVRDALATGGYPRVEQTPDVASSAHNDPDAAAHAAELAFLTVTRIAEMLIAAGETPLGLIGSGALRSVERRRLTDLGLPSEPEIIDQLHQLALRGGLLQTASAGVVPTHAATLWLESSFTQRWGSLTRELLDSLPETLRAAPIPQWPFVFPWNAKWPGVSTDEQTRLTLVGLIDANEMWTPWAQHQLSGDFDAAAGALAQFVPHEVDRVFVQHDYTVMAPGPLQPRFDLALRRFSEREAGGHASSYRLTAESITRGLQTGGSADELLRLLGEISLSGIPQPVEYLIHTTAHRHGAVQVSVHPVTGTSLVTTSDATIMQHLIADRALHVLGFKTEGAGLVTPMSPSSTYYALLDAGYSAVLRDELEATSATAIPEPPTKAHDVTKLIAVLRAGESDTSAASWLGRELELAARERATVVVEVALPDGTARELTLQVNAFSSGRLRGLDRAAEVERTLPLASILSVRAF